MKLIIGLGNIGEKYDLTRHNVGFFMLDQFAIHYDFPNWQENKKMQSLITKGLCNEEQIILTKPTTFMNMSGNAVVRVASYYDVKPEDILLVYDDKDLPFGTIRQKRGGGSGGHNGIKSLPKSIQEQSRRIKIGVANDLTAITDTSDFVLSKFNKQELETLEVDLTEKTTQFILEFLS